MRVGGAAWVQPAELLPARTPRRHEEDDLQRAVWHYLQWALPDDAVAYHPPNGGQRHRKAAARMAGLGVLRGVPDLAIVWRGRALFIELKAAKGTVSAAQRALHRKLLYCGAEVMLCRSVPEVEAALRECGMTPLGHVTA